ncbi:MAG: PilZ domain-containing protein [Oscillospiraceae bacterium]|nr:PilZ domain-containing protein [Oscillospiraceae bacterium]
MLATPINRQYVRTDNWSVTASVSKSDSAEWHDASVLDIAAGGLLFLTDSSYEKGDLLRFDLSIDPMTPGISQIIPMKVAGIITDDRGVRDGKRAFSVKFTEISSKDRIRIDELVRMTNYMYKLDSNMDYLDR